MEAIGNLLQRRLIDLTGEDFVTLARYAAISGSEKAPTEQAIGINALATALSCSPSQISNMRRDGILDDAIISRVGRHIVFNVDIARHAANEWYEAKRQSSKS